MEIVGEKVHLNFVRVFAPTSKQGCQMVWFQTKNPNLGKFWRASDWKMFSGHLEYFMEIWDILWRFWTFYGDLVYFMTVWYILCSFGTFFPVLV
jgi:hypothetical protein